MDDAHGPPADPPNRAASAADAMAMAQEAEADAAAAEALAAAAQARARAARLKREAMAMADTVEGYGDAALAAADAQAFEDSTAEDEYEYYDDADEEYGDEEYADEEYADQERDEKVAAPKPPPAWLRWLPSPSIVAKVTALLLTCAFVGFTVYMVMQHRHAIQHDKREAAFAAGATRGIINMTSLDYKKAREDVQRVIDSATGEFKNDFQSRASDFAAVVTQSKSITEGTVNATAVESMNGNSAKVLVSATSRITNSPPGKAEAPRIWRLRVTVTDVGGQYKMSKVEYVP